MLETLHSWASAIWPVWLFILFVGIVIWALLPRNKARFERYGKIPLNDDQRKD